jgi:hypothetical protein
MKLGRMEWRNKAQSNIISFPCVTGPSRSITLRSLWPSETGLDFRAHRNSQHATHLRNVNSIRKPGTHRCPIIRFRHRYTSVSIPKIVTINLLRLPWLTSDQWKALLRLLSVAHYRKKRVQEALGDQKWPLCPGAPRWEPALLSKRGLTHSAVNRVASWPCGSADREHALKRRSSTASPVDPDGLASKWHHQKAVRDRFLALRGVPSR